MFKSLNSLENKMYKVLKEICNSKNCLKTIANEDVEFCNVLNACYECKYVENIDKWTDENGNYHFSSLGNTHVNKAGLAFMKTVSCWEKFKRTLAYIFKGITMYFLGILSTLIAEIILLLITNPKTIEEFLQNIPPL